MKEITVYISLILTVALLGCTTSSEKDRTDNNNDSVEDNFVIITGNILNHHKHPDNYTIRIFEHNLVNSKGINHPVFIEQNGSFKFKFKKHYTSDVYLIYGNMITLFVGPGDSIFIEFDADEFLDPIPENKYNPKTLNFSGDKMHINKQIKLFKSLIFDTKQFKKSYENEKTFPPEEYLIYLKKLKSQREKVLDSLIQNRNLTEEFIDWGRLYVRYEFGAQLLHYTWFYPFANQKEKEFKVIDIPTSFYESLEYLPLDNEGATICSAYRRFLHEYFVTHTSYRSSLSEKLKKSRGKFAKSKLFEAEYRTFLQTIEKEYKGIAKEIFLSRNLFNLLDSYDRIDVFDKLYPEFKSEIRESFYKTLEEKYSELKLREKSPLNNKSLQKEGKEIKGLNSDVLKEIIENNQEKVIYIDFWATWCGPCLMEFPNSKKLHKELKGRDVAFVYLCVKSKQNEWEEKLTEYNLGGSHYLLNDPQYDILSQQFQISGIPHYVLIDKNGTIVEKGSHLRPNIVKEKIEKLLNK